LTLLIVIGIQQTSAETVSGTVSVWKAKAKTEGPRNDKDVVVFLEKAGNDKYSAPIKHAKLDQKGLLFVPHVLVVQKGEQR
jgi:hypothetical protein